MARDEATCPDCGQVVTLPDLGRSPVDKPRLARLLQRADEKRQEAQAEMDEDE